MALGAEELNDLQQQIASGYATDERQVAALVAEVWRLKALVRGKTIELDSVRAEAGELESLLEILLEENDALKAEIEESKAIHGLPVCQLEGRWSNCAVRMRKANETSPAPVAANQAEVQAPPASPKRQ